MKPNEQISMEAWVNNWKTLGPILERLKIDEHRSSDLAQTLLSLNDVNEAALEANPPKPYSGMIEMQRLFTKLRTNETGS
ncbi:MAG: hypothetical protein IT173_01915 [Acidobacteria bacterium]|nr:hypothetical protein [Acidobacteriota bacterium]